MSPKKEILQTKPIKTSREISYEQNCFLFFAFRRHGEEKVVVDGIFFFFNWFRTFLWREKSGTKFEKIIIVICNNRYGFYKFPR